MSEQQCPENAGSSPQSLSDLPPLVRLRRLAIGLAVFLFIMFVLAPLPVKYFGPMRDYARTVNETGIIPGALYYTDVPQTVDGEINNRDAIRYFTGKDKDGAR